MGFTFIVAFFLLASTAFAGCGGATYGWYTQTDNRVVGTSIFTQLTPCLWETPDDPPSGGPPSFNPDPPHQDPIHTPEPSAIPELVLCAAGIGYYAVRRRRAAQRNGLTELSR
jgi:hypothetical protein